MTRFHPPYILEDVRLLAQHSDQLTINAKEAWNEFLRYVNCLILNHSRTSSLSFPFSYACENSVCIHTVQMFSFSDFSGDYGAYKKAVDLLAKLDCLLSLAKVAAMPGYIWYSTSVYLLLLIR